MVIVNPYPYPNTGDPLYPQFPPSQPWYPDTWTIKEIKEVEKKWKERHIKNVKRGILITFDDNEDPLFIATDDACFQKILEAIKDEGHKDNKRD